MATQTQTSERSRAGDAATDLVLEVFRANGALLAAGDAMTRDLGLSSARWQVLGALERQPLTVSQIAREMGLTRQSVQRIANALADEGLLAWQDNPQHKRARLLQLTAPARQRLAVINQRQARWADALADGTTLRTLQAATATLRQLRTRLQRR